MYSNPGPNESQSHRDPPLPPIMLIKKKLTKDMRKKSQDDPGMKANPTSSI